VWAECLRVLKPGGHLLAFAGTRTQHRMAVRIEDAGFEIRDMIAWVYSTGFPKSLNLDHERGKTTCGCDGGTVPYAHGKQEAQHRLRSLHDADVPTALHAGEGRALLQPSVPQQGTPAEGRQQLSSAEVRGGQPGVEGRGDAPSQEGELRSGQVRQGPDMGEGDGSSGRLCDASPAGDGGMVRIPADADGVRSPRRPQPAKQRKGKPSTVAGQPIPQNVGAWETCGRCGLPCVPKGLGTALKPALEPLTVARKPLIGTVAENVTTWGTGAINVDGGRVGWASDADKASGRPASLPKAHDGIDGQAFKIADRSHRDPIAEQSSLGRFPANLIHDGSDEVVGLFPETTSGKMQPTTTTAGRVVYGQNAAGGYTTMETYGDSGSAARFFYCAKASAEDRDDGCHALPPKTAGEVTGGRAEGSAGLSSPRSGAGRRRDETHNHHPTVKPTDLMRYLCRLVTPPGGTVLDPFVGSGSTGRGAILEGFSFVGIEREAEYVEIARVRIAAAVAQRKKETAQLTMF
jgi:hypothetical protein